MGAVLVDAVVKGVRALVSQRSPTGAGFVALIFGYTEDLATRTACATQERGVMTNTGILGEQKVGVWRESKARPGFWLRTIFTLGLWYLIVYKHNYIEVTNQIVTQKRGNLFSGNETTMRVDRITDINLNQSFLGNLMNYGDITIQSAGSADAEIAKKGMANPKQLRQVILDLRDGVLDNPI